jgi:uncharacterized protein DUF4304
MLDREVTPLLTGYGFERDGLMYRLTGPIGDQALIEFQRSANTWAREFWFFVNVALVPVTALAWRRHRGEIGADHQPRIPDGIWRTRLNQPDPMAEGWIITDAESAEQVRHELCERLSRWLPDLVTLVDRRTVLDRLRRGELNLPELHPPTVELELLIAEGPSPRLDELLTEAERRAQERGQDYWVEHARWARRYAAQVPR